MFHQRLALASALCVAACAQIAGFEQLSSRKPDDASGGNGTASAAGASLADGGSVAGRGQLGASAGASANGGMSSSAGGEGGVTSGGSGPTAGTAGASGGAQNASAGAAGATAGASGAAGAPVVGGCNAQLLKYADFDAGPVEWRLESNVPGIFELSDVIVKDTNQALIKANVAPRSGNYLAWLGGALDSDKGSHMSLMQDVLIPAKVSRLVLSGWIQIKTTEPDPKETSDQLDLTLQDDNMFWSFHYWKGTDVTNGWQSFSYEFSDAARLDVLRGRTLTFYAEARADTTEVTSYWLDSLSLFAECPH